MYEEHYTQKFQDVLDLEHQHINASRERAEMPTDVYTALAISGGGIRSASFALGVIQGLVSANLLKKWIICLLHQGRLYRFGTHVVFTSRHKP